MQSKISCLQTYEGPGLGILYKMVHPFYSSQENEITLAGRAKSDAREMQSFYQHYYKKYIQALQQVADKADRYDVLKFDKIF